MSTDGVVNKAKKISQKVEQEDKNMKNKKRLKY